MVKAAGDQHFVARYYLTLLGTLVFFIAFHFFFAFPELDFSIWRCYCPENDIEFLNRL